MENEVKPRDQRLHVAKEVAITTALVIGPVIGFFLILAAVFVGAFFVFGPI